MLDATHSTNYPALLVLGAGKTGQAVLELALKVQDPWSRIVLVGGEGSHASSALDALASQGVELALDTTVMPEFGPDTDVLCVASPGIPLDSDFARAAQEVAKLGYVSEPEFCARYKSPAKTLAITGTNGKTTTTTLTCAMLQEAGKDAVAVGNIGRAIAAELVDEAADARNAYFVEELSSFQLATCKTLHAHVAVLLNITPDHLEWHHTLEHYIASKAKVFNNLVAGDLAICNIDDEHARAVFNTLAARSKTDHFELMALSLHGLHTDLIHSERTLFYNEKNHMISCYLRSTDSVVELLDVHAMQLKGIHNVQNVMAALAAALHTGAKLDSVVETARHFSPLEHRIEPVATVDGVLYVNDSKGTNTDATIKAIESFEAGHVIVLLGGHDKHTDLSELVACTHAYARVAICYGDAGERIAQALEQSAPEVESSAKVVRAPHMREAFACAKSEAHSGDVVLLSPACSSFDEFSGMAERGRVFKSLVEALKSESNE